MKKWVMLQFFLPGIIVLFLIWGIIAFPKDAVDSARIGMTIWLNILVPSLLPFLIGAHLLIHLKIIDIIGLFFEPIARRLFNVPGKSSLVFAMSITSGYPIGSKLTAELREKKEITKWEAQRLASFCSTSGPLFIVGSVAVGMFKNYRIGYFIALCHYLGALTVGLLFRNYGVKFEKKDIFKKKINIMEEIKKIVLSRNKEDKGFYIILAEAVKSGINTVLAVGGFVILFSVVFRILSVLKCIQGLTNAFFFLLYPFHIPKEVIYAFISGLFEITIGCNNVSLCHNASFLFKVALCTFIISFSGLSILAQCSSFLGKTDINISIYILSKFLHGILAFTYCYVLYPLFKNNLNITTFYPSIYNPLYTHSIGTKIIFFNKILFFFSFIIYIFSYIKDIPQKNKG